MKSQSYRYFKIIGVVLIFFMVVVHLIAYNIRGKEKLNFAERAILTVAWPVQSFFNSTLNRISDIWTGYISLVHTEKKNVSLENENATLKGLVVKMSEIQIENERLKKLLGFTEGTQDKYVAARVIANGPSNFFHTLILDKGSKDGIQRGMAVVVGQGVVGQVAYVTGGYSSVITLLDPSSAIDAMDQVTRARGILRGYRSGKLAFKYLPFSEKVNVGEAVISTGLDGVFPKSLPIGQIESVDSKKEALFQDVYVRPAVDFAKLEEVLINLKMKPKEEIQIK